jgi:hypothetical protein
MAAAKAWDPESPFPPSQVAPRSAPRSAGGGGRRRAGPLLAVVDRERILNDLGNTGVAAALIGGFALGSLDLSNGLPVYMCSLLSVHGCTCAALISALCYRTINMMNEDDAVAWATKKQWILQMPLMKFGIGTISYVTQVMIRSYNELNEKHSDWKWVGLVLGIGSVMMMIGAAILLKCTGPKMAKAQ